MDIIHAVGMDETYGAFVDDDCFDIHDYDDCADHGTDEDTDDDTGDDSNDDTDHESRSIKFGYVELNFVKLN